MMALIAKKIKLENEIEKGIAKLIEKYGEIPEHYREDIMDFYKTQAVWDTYLTELMENLKDELEDQDGGE